MYRRSKKKKKKEKKRRLYQNLDKEFNIFLMSITWSPGLFVPHVDKKDFLFPLWINDN